MPVTRAVVDSGLARWIAVPGAAGLLALALSVNPSARRPVEGAPDPRPRAFAAHATPGPGEQLASPLLPGFAATVGELIPALV